MLLGFFLHLREYRVPVSIRELLDLMAALRKRLVFADAEQFYFLCRLCLAFDAFFNGLDDWEGIFEGPGNRDALRQIVTSLFPHLGELDLDRLLTEYEARLNDARPGSPRS